MAKCFKSWNHVIYIMTLPVFYDFSTTVDFSHFVSTVKYIGYTYHANFIINRFASVNIPGNPKKKKI